MTWIDPAALGIPSLTLDRQALDLYEPVIPYGTIPRGHEMRGTFHFYVADQKFTRLFAAPHRILNTGCRACFEPNCSTGPDVPLAAALFGIHRKRAVASIWQSWGLDIVVDLSVDDSVLPYALLGVPLGWRSYAVRSHRFHGLDWIERRHAMAVERAAGEDVTFTVVGGGKAVRETCEARGWLQVPEHCRLVRLKQRA